MCFKPGHSLVTGLALLAMSFSHQVLATPLAERGKPLVYMIQWRGETSTDLGFRDYFEQAGLAAEFLVRDADRDPDRLRIFVDEIAELQPDLVYTWSMAAAQGIVGTKDTVDPVHHVTDRPVVTCMVADPVVAGISDSWTSSGRNFTGVSHVAPVETQLRAMSLYADIEHLAVLYNPTEASPVSTVHELRQFAEQDDFGFALSEWPVPLDDNGTPQADALADLIARIAETRPDFLYLGPDSFLAVHRALVTAEARKHGLPTFVSSEVYVREGEALAGLISNYYNVGQYCGYKAEQILSHGMDPADIPFDTLKRFSYLVNLKTARELRFYPPIAILNFAEIVNE